MRKIFFDGPDYHNTKFIYFSEMLISLTSFIGCKNKNETDQDTIDNLKGLIERELSLLMNDQDKKELRARLKSNPMYKLGKKKNKKVKK